MISVEEALAACLALTRVLPSERVALSDASGRVLAEPVFAARDQPPFAASAMDGYALRSADAGPGARLRVMGEAPAGRAWDGEIAAGEVLRIFTGAPMPRGADRVVIQEDVTREGDDMVIGPEVDAGPHVRPAGADFRAGARIEAPRRLGPADLALAAAMNAPALVVTKRPVVALIPTGDELVLPGDAPRDDQIVASNIYGLKAIVEAQGGVARILPIARDTAASLGAVLNLAADADVIVTVGGASVGDHDLVGDVTDDLGMERSFYKIAMRPGKPLMAGRLGQSALLGLPGNPVSALVCGHLFLVPMLRGFLGLKTGARRRRIARLGIDLGENGPREHYMRAEVQPSGDMAEIVPFDRQDSSLLTIFSRANALLIRPVADPPRKAGARVEYLPLGPIAE